MISRRMLLARAVTALGGITALPSLLDQLGVLDRALAATPDLTHDTINGLVAFLLPGPDAYSIQQGLSTADPGGVDAGVAQPYIDALNLDFAFLPTLADMVAALLNDTALAINPGSADGPFPSAFANLSYGDKATVFAVLDGDPTFESLRNLISIVPGLLVFIAISEAPVWDRASRTVTGTPFGWESTGFTGPAEGRDDFRGYYLNRRKADA